MKHIGTFLFFHLFFVCTYAKDKVYVGSTPAGPEVRAFLGISMSDSIDFIRWKINFNDSGFQLSCNYGIGKPNTNGFINGGKRVEFTGRLKKEKNYYILVKDNRSLSLAELNDDLVHFGNIKHQLLIGNGGFSYALNSTTPIHSIEINGNSTPSTFKDSMVFVGRTPCGVPGVIEPGKLCYKIKWLIVFYPATEKNGIGKYKVRGTPYRLEGGKVGNWSIRKGADGRISYILNDAQDKPFLFLQKIDDNILIFTDSDGKLLVGDEDFSYTMNRDK